MGGGLFYVDVFMTLYRDPGVEKKCKFGTDMLLPCMQEKEARDSVLQRG